MKTAPELWNLLREADDLPWGSAKIAIIEQVLRHVDTVGDPRLAFVARLDATQAYVYGGEPAKAFAPFSWAVADYDTKPEPYHQRQIGTLLWLFKTMVSALTKFPEIPLARTYAVLDDMERRYREYGQGMQALYKHRYVVASHIGDTEEARRWYERWQAAPRDQLSDCAGCDPTSTANYLAEIERYEDVVALAEPVLAGRLTCTEQPHGILNALMVPYLKLGRAGDAAAAHRRSYLLERGNLADLSDLADHVEFCVRTGNPHRALEIFQRHLDWLEIAPSPYAEMRFAAAGALLLNHLAEHEQGGDIVIRRRDLPDVTVAELGPILTERATALGRRFDERNGTSYQGGLVAETIASQPYETPVALSATARTVAPVAQRPQEKPEEIPEVPAGATVEELLDLARDLKREERIGGVRAVLAELDARFPDLDDLSAGRRAMLRGDLLSADDQQDLATVLAEWDTAIAFFTAAGAEGEIVTTQARQASRRAYSGDIDPGPIEANLSYQEEHGDLRDRATAWMGMSVLHHLRHEHDEAIKAGFRARELALEHGAPRLIATIDMMQAGNLDAAGRHEEAVAATRAGWPFFRDSASGKNRARMAMIYGMHSADAAERADIFGQVIGAGLTGAELPARAERGRALVAIGRAREAIADLVEAVNLCAEHDYVEGGGFARVDLAHAYQRAERFPEAAEVAEEALRIFEGLDGEFPIDDTKFLLATIYRQLGDDKTAVALYRELIERQADNPAGRGQIAEEAGNLLYEKDRDAEAAEMFELAATSLHEAGDLIGELRALRRLIGALHYSDQEDLGEEAIALAAERSAALPPELAAEPNAIFQRGLTAFESGRLRMQRGRYADALPELRLAPAGLRSIGATHEADRLEGMLGEALLRSGDAEQAEPLMRALLDRTSPDDPSFEMIKTIHQEAVDNLPKRRFRGRS